MTGPGDLSGRELNRRYAIAEQSLDRDRAKRARRTPVLLIALTALLIAGVGLVASADLRRLQTPRGTALAWTEAAVFGDCRGYDRLSLRDTAGAGDLRTGDQRCNALRQRSQDARLHSGSIRIDAVSVTRVGATATVEVRLTRAGAASTAALSLVRRGGGWAVVRNAVACSQIGCA